MPQNQITCKKCGGLHGIDVWRDVWFYYCPKVNRVILLDMSKKEVAHEHEDGMGTA